MDDTLLTFIHITDTHITSDRSYMGNYADYTPIVGAEALVRELNALPFTPDFVLHTGDVVYDPVPEAYETAKAVLGKLKYPVYYLPGNHDDPLSLQPMTVRSQAQTALYYAFEVKGVQIVCLDSNGHLEPPAGYISDQQLIWLADLCAAKDDRPLVVAVHHNPFKVGVPWLDEYMGLQNDDALHRALLPARDRLRGVFCGHIHQNIDVLRDGILYTSTLSSWSQFHAWVGMTETHPDQRAEPGFSAVTISRSQTFIRRYRFAL